MDAGVPISSPVSGIAMGLLIENGQYIILSDIQGLEDHYGDMDFKVSGTQKGITALQLDIKVSGLSDQILREALTQAKLGRLHILEKMVATISTPREELAQHAPKIVFLKINPEKVGLVIGPGGKTIKKIEEDSKTSVYVTDSINGVVSIAAKNSEDMEKARSLILALTKDVEPGEVYEGRVTRLMKFGAFIELIPGKEGLLHISKISDQMIKNIEDVLSVGDSITVKVQAIDDQNRINLMRA